MAEALGVVASIVALIRITDRVVGLCRFYIDSLDNKPLAIRAILLEISTLNSIFKNLEFLITHDRMPQRKFAALPVRTVYSRPVVQHLGNDGLKRRKLKAALAWPFKERSARKILEDISQYKATTSLTMTIDSHQAVKDVKTKAREIYELLTDTE
ncbi:hypothetical protein BCR34DRAFT_585913 [Clohesyomyces aquaticus]|uniref:Uncharacterized protein n=1 Tax=Clohesyomyces aquaticus TaxID=1231657 RepID=A0A1Y1ZVL7_9PLEO|nr:hypothetical protein BCR34DRAFT_585913 [Clohesyomyces aquaticus]